MRNKSFNGLCDNIVFDSQGLRLVVIVIVTSTVSLWYAWRWVHGISIEVERPFVYRQFVPVIAGLISRLSGAHVNVSVIPVVILCAIVFAFACGELYYRYHGRHSALFVFTNVAILFLVISDDTKTYDVPTAMFFALALLLMERRQLILYELLFPFICLNRETAILLTLLFAIYFFPRLARRAWIWHLVYQFLIWLAIRLAFVWIFADAPGSAFWFRPLENLLIYVHDKPATILFLLAAIAIAYIIHLKWQQAPELMRAALLIFVPVLLVVYLVIGVTFEIRVFLELLPVVTVIGAS